MSSGPISVESAEPAEPEVVESEEVLAARRARARWLLPLVALLIGSIVASLLFLTKPEVVKSTPEVLPPSVLTLIVQPELVRLSVVTHGSVAPRTESDLVAEVRGRIVWVSPSLVAGGFFAAGDELLRLDGREHQIAVDSARAHLKLRRSEVRLAAADAKRRRALLARGAASSADVELFESRSQVAAANVEQARASLAQAELDLERTVVLAPFEGRVRERPVDVGQFVNPGTKVARVYAVDYAEVRLPVQTDALSYLAFPPVSLENGSAEAGNGAAVILRARLAGREFEWPARIVRNEGEIDARTRMMHLVARVDDPYGSDEGRTPLPAGLFVKAEIEGREIDGAFVLPISALRDDDTVFLVEGEDRLVRRSVEIVRRSSDKIVVTGGLEAGERVILSPLRIVTEGMVVRPVATPASAGADS